jgi:hypothetical protein
VQYFVVAPDGTSYGPADLPTLQQWANEGRVLADSQLRSVATGQTVLASNLPGLVVGSGIQSTAPGPYGYGPSGPYGQGSGYYPRPGLMDDGSKEFTTGLVMGILSLVCCGILGLVFGIIGVVYSKRALQKGHRQATTALILSYVGIGLGIVVSVLRVVGIFAFGI